MQWYPPYECAGSLRKDSWLRERHVPRMDTVREKKKENPSWLPEPEPAAVRPVDGG